MSARVGVAARPAAVLAFACLAGVPAWASAQVRLDHVPIAVADLDAAVQDFAALGFTIKPGRPHANSIRNAHIKFADGTALELITATEPRDAVAARYVTFLRDGEGAAYVSLTGDSPEAVAATLEAMSIAYERVQGSWYEWLTFDEASPFGHLFFGWVTAPPADPPSVFRHANGAARLAAVWMAGAAARDSALLSALGAVSAGDARLPVGSAQVLRTGRGDVYLGARAERRIPGVTIAVPDLDAVLAQVSGAVAGRDARGRFARIPPERAHGVWIELLETHTRATNATGRPSRVLDPHPEPR